jgi:hypothetical protein
VSFKKVDRGLFAHPCGYPSPPHFCEVADDIDTSTWVGDQLTGWSTISCLRHHRQTSVIIGECSRLYHHILVNILESLDVYLYLRAFLKQIHSSHIHYLALVARVIALFKPILHAAHSFHDNCYASTKRNVVYMGSDA